MIKIEQVYRMENVEDVHSDIQQAIKYFENIYQSKALDITVELVSSESLVALTVWFDEEI